MGDFAQVDLTGSTFHQVHLDGAAFREVSLRDARFEDVDLTGAIVSGAFLVDLELTGEIRNLVVNGVDVAPFVEAELDRRHPERSLMRPTDPAGFRLAWDTLEALWSQTVDRARRLAPPLLHERVDGEWSFIETQRHLVFATDAWINRALLGDPSPWHPLDLPHDDMPDEPSVPRDLDARPRSTRCWSSGPIARRSCAAWSRASPTNSSPTPPPPSPSPATRSRSASRYGAVSAASSPRSSGTARTPSETSPSSSSERADASGPDPFELPRRLM